jgi:hypothetical protein
VVVVDPERETAAGSGDHGSFTLTLPECPEVSRPCSVVDTILSQTLFRGNRSIHCRLRGIQSRLASSVPGEATRRTAFVDCSHWQARTTLSDSQSWRNGACCANLTRTWKNAPFAARAATRAGSPPQRGGHAAGAFCGSGGTPFTATRTRALLLRRRIFTRCCRLGAPLARRLGRSPARHHPRLLRVAGSGRTGASNELRVGRTCRRRARISKPSPSFPIFVGRTTRD